MSPNLHVALALALGVQPDRSDAELIAHVEHLRVQAAACPCCSARPPATRPRSRTRSPRGA